MMLYDKKITKENAYFIINQFAKEYRKELGKIPGEIIIVGGGSIMLNYKFRDTTQDFDVILRTSSEIKDVIKKFADKYELPRDWMNSDFKNTISYSDRLSEVSKHYRTLNNGTLEIRTVSGVYLIAMKLRAHRDYRNDISDAIGILIEEMESGNSISFEDIQNAYKRLYDNDLPSGLIERLNIIYNMNINELKSYYKKQLLLEKEIGSRVISYIDNGAHINTHNVDYVINKIKDKMKK